MERVYMKYDYKIFHQANFSTQSNIRKAEDNPQVEEPFAAHVRD